MRVWPEGGLWRHRDFLTLWAAQSVSALGNRITRTALPVIAVLAVDGSALELGVLAAVSFGPAALVGLLLGGTIDRARKRPLLIAADLTRALLVSSIPLAAVLDVLTMFQLYAVAGALGCANALFELTDNAYLPSLVAREQLVEGNAKLETTEALAEVAGPGLGGALIGWLGAPWAMVIDAASYLWSALWLGRIRAVECPAAPTPGDSVRADLRAGVRACWSDPTLRALLLASGVFAGAMGFLSALYMLYGLKELRLSPATLGVIIGLGGVSALFGALLATRVGALLSPRSALLVCLLVGQASMLLIPLAGRGSQGWAVMLLSAQQLIGDGFFTAYFIHAVSLRQRVLPAALLARGNGVFTVVFSLLLPGGALLAGALGGRIGVEPTLWIGAVWGLLAPLCLMVPRSTAVPSAPA
jgi:predicted MFS family arabinose efflux permease